MAETVRMIRDAKAHPDSHEANVDVRDVATFEGLGWSRADASDEPKAAPKPRAPRAAKAD